MLLHFVLQQIITCITFDPTQTGSLLCQLTVNSSQKQILHNDNYWNERTLCIFQTATSSQAPLSSSKAKIYKAKFLHFSLNNYNISLPLPNAQKTRLSQPTLTYLVLADSRDSFSEVNKRENWKWMQISHLREFTIVSGMWQMSVSEEENTSSWWKSQTQHVSL